MTLDAAQWNGTGGELSSCVINNILLDHVLLYSEHFWNKFTSWLLSCFVLCAYIYIIIIFI